ncbi:MAG: hypothetical protein H6737_23145 [Alphaproteobacteria bacterium]|nr:hypothetical protein [Alphaproteobacteria bacterium]
MISMLAITAMANPNYASGSTGADGAIFVGTGTSLELPLPADGVLNATTVTVEAGGTLTFTPNAQNTPVFLLATGDVQIDGLVSVNGSDGTETAGGEGGPGGFRGGQPGFGVGPGRLTGGAGFGPGGVRSEQGPSLLTVVPLGTCLASASGGHLSGGTAVGSARAGAGFPVSAAPQGFPMLGGSGGGGMYSYNISAATNPELNCGGGGGAGAIQIASSTRITVDGAIEAHGGGVDATCAAKAPAHQFCNYGSDGRIRLVAPLVDGTGTVSAANPAGFAGPGSVRIDTLRPTVDPAGLTVQAASGGAYLGYILTTFPVGPETPRVVIESFNGSALTADDSAQFVVVPNGTANPVPVTLRVDDFGNRDAWTLVVSGTEKQGVAAFTGSCTVANASVDNTCDTTVNLQALKVYETTAFAR